MKISATNPNFLFTVFFYFGAADPGSICIVSGSLSLSILNVGSLSA